MAVLLDTSNVDKIRTMLRTGIVSGVTTNPKILSQEQSLDLKQVVLSVTEMTGFPVHVEVTKEDVEGMIAQAREFHSWAPSNIVVKIPGTWAGLEAISFLSRTLHIETNATCLMNANQAYVALMAGASYVSLFCGRIRDMGYSPTDILRDLRKTIDRDRLEGKVIAASIRHSEEMFQYIAAGAHFVTLTPELLRKALWNPNTDLTVAEFNRLAQQAAGPGGC